MAEKSKQQAILAFKLALDIENVLNIKKILETKILDTKVEFTLKELLGITKKEFHEVIIDMSKEVANEASGVNAIKIQEFVHY